MENNIYIEAFKNFLSEDQLEYIQKGIESGFTAEQIRIYAKPKFFGEQMEVIFNAIKDGLTEEQINIAIDKADDFWEMDDICNGFKLGISINEMNEILSDEEWPDKLLEKSNQLLNDIRAENMESARKFVDTYKSENPVNLLPSSILVVKLFKDKYIESGWRYNGCLKLSELLDAGIKQETIDKLIESKIINKRETIVPTYDLSLIERFSLIDKYNLSEEWEKTGKGNFRLNNGYNGEIHTVLREVMKLKEQYIESYKLHDILNHEISVSDYIDIIEIAKYEVEANTVEQLINEMDKASKDENEPLWNYPIEEKEYCIKEGIIAILVKDDSDSRYFELPSVCWDMVKEKITDGDIKRIHNEFQPIRTFENKEEFIHEFYKHLVSEGEVPEDFYARQMIESDVYNGRGKEWLEGIEVTDKNKCYFKYLCKDYGDFETDNIWIGVYKDTLGYEDNYDNITEIYIPSDWLLDYLLNKRINPDQWIEEYTADATIPIVAKAIEDKVIIECSDKNIDIIKFQDVTKMNILEDDINVSANYKSIDEIIKGANHKRNGIGDEDICPDLPLKKEENKKDFYPTIEI